MRSAYYVAQGVSEIESAYYDDYSIVSVTWDDRTPVALMKKYSRMCFQSMIPNKTHEAVYVIETVGGLEVFRRRFDFWAINEWGAIVPVEYHDMHASDIGEVANLMGLETIGQEHLQDQVYIDEYKADLEMFSPRLEKKAADDSTKT